MKPAVTCVVRFIKTPYLIFFCIVSALCAGDLKPTTGQDYRQWPDSMRLGFASGYYSGYASARGRFEQAMARFDNLLNCLHTFSYGQTEAILDKYVADHPERWDNAIEYLAEDAFIDACEKKTGLAVTQAATLPADGKTDTLLNGIGWNFLNTVSWGSETKIYYVRGLAEAYALSGLTATPCGEYLGSNIDDVVREFDRLYQDTANLRIPMANLLPAVVSRLKGTCSDEQLQTVVGAWRRWAATGGKEQTATKQ
jgi:hypothetical protein